MDVCAHTCVCVCVCVCVYVRVRIRIDVHTCHHEYAPEIKFRSLRHSRVDSVIVATSLWLQVLHTDHTTAARSRTETIPLSLQGGFAQANVFVVIVIIAVNEIVVPDFAPRRLPHLPGRNVGDWDGETRVYLAGTQLTLLDIHGHAPRANIETEDGSTPLVDGMTRQSPVFLGLLLALEDAHDCVANLAALHHLLRRHITGVDGQFQTTLEDAFLDIARYSRPLRMSWHRH